MTISRPDFAVTSFENSTDPDQLTSEETNSSESILFLHKLQHGIAPE